MSSAEPSLRIEAPTEELLPGRGFYQLEEESLYVQIAPFSKEHRFFSFLESEHVRFDLDRNGRLLFVEVSAPRRSWRVDESLEAPTRAEPADVRWLDFRTTMPDPHLLTNQQRTVLFLDFAHKETRFISLADTVVIGVTENDQLGSVWVGDIVDDTAGRLIAAYRKRYQPGTSVSR